MKRVKIMLTALTVLAIVGGALAFKAKSDGFLYICNGTICVESQRQYTDNGHIKVENATFDDDAEGEACELSCSEDVFVTPQD